MKVKNGGKKKSNRAGRLFMGALFFFLMAVMSMQVFQLYQKRNDYRAVEAAKQEELEAQEARQEELIQYEIYTQSDEYVEDMAQARLGMVYGDEIIFREKE